ncbi:dihydrolipoamide acetyltransferase family protein [Paramicrobacterium agarici]|uniref:Dihydrolipoamide acetyltransferase component of pyruvate dehydrogenase complex n=1 Tax=Paramicrobacterium agarici TaxID=630514 RepID=A0A2A9DYG1_9MICO|nr:dihydrolipoamide acetyltransferase family protein [Microbacterium agarici]PFG31022.1 pyruvate dehydrogenase E2 component (dihydrolipoamide acetyltransferase) [Microbacterium agarici]TQO24086.1 pyruvate dehydrogenase E2 component (dihydrolipoamide acetyltransferase) [Microbacterium agarici]
MSVKDFLLPDLGEGLTESEIASWKIAEGDTVSVNQVIAEIETAKALVELPSPFDGTIRTLYAEEGATVQVGEPLIAFELDGDDDEPGDAPPEREPVLVGYGPKKERSAAPRRRRRSWEGEKTQAPDQRPDASAAPASTTEAPASDAPETPNRPERPRTTPPVRIFAREIGVDLTEIEGTGSDGLITRSDVQRAAHAAQPEARQSVRETAPERGEVRTPIKGVRKATAAAMASSAFTAPHASEFITIDVTRTGELVARLRTQHPDTRITIMTIVSQAMLLAAKRTPSVNAHWDDEAQEIVEYGYVNLGVAAATQRGLVVPVVKDADTLGLLELADAISALVSTARDGRTQPEDMSGGTMTLTNVGVFGVDAGTPILTPGQSSILAAGAVRRRPWEYDGEIALRDVMTLSLSFDHRIVDGEQASRFLVDVSRVLEDPGTALTLL